jgi:transposase-like protein
MVDEKEKYHECELCNAQNKKTKYHKLFDGYLCKACRKEFHHYYYNDVNGQKIGY